MYTETTTYLIYAGGTFGCHGTPLTALDSGQFLSAFLALCQKHSHHVHAISNPIIKDSSTLTPEDFLHFFELITNAYQQGARRFVLITGTDTLAYLSAFLCVGLRGLPLTLVVTGSMLPLFDPTKTPLQKNPNSDAWHNFSNALTFIAQNIHGSFVSIQGTIYYGDSLQKIHKTDINAFSGTAFDTSTHKPPITTAHPKPPFFTDTVIYSFYCLPNQPDILAEYLESLTQKPSSAVLIQGFGAGNMPKSPKLIQAISTLTQQHFLLIMTSSALYGSVNTDYQAGAWQYQYGMVSGFHYPIPALYAQALWICLTTPKENRKQAWNQLYGVS